MEGAAIGRVELAKDRNAWRKVVKAGMRKYENEEKKGKKKSRRRVRRGEELLETTVGGDDPIGMTQELEALRLEIASKADMLGRNWRTLAEMDKDARRRNEIRERWKGNG